VVALVALVELPVLLKLRENAVEVVRLDLHPLSQLRNRDPGLLVHVRQHLLRPTATPARTPPSPGRSGGLGGSRTLRHRLTRQARDCRHPLCSLAHTLERIERLTDPTQLEMVMVPKVAGAAELAELERFRLIPICETATGIIAAAEIAAARGCVAVLWGSEDLTADLGGRSSRRADGSYQHVIQHARSSVLLAARANGRVAIDGVYLAIDDLDGLAREAAEGATIGFRAKACIHPKQVETVRVAFAPRSEEVTWARGLLEAASATKAGVFSYQGRMVDAPLLRHAEAILASAQRLPMTQRQPDPSS
jgi:citrate lyase subunit beta/citryl-CoA lyase